MKGMKWLSASSKTVKFLLWAMYSMHRQEKEKDEYFKVISVSLSNTFLNKPLLPFHLCAAKTLSCFKLTLAFRWMPNHYCWKFSKQILPVCAVRIKMKTKNRTQIKHIKSPWRTKPYHSHGNLCKTLLPQTASKSLSLPAVLLGDKYKTN